MTRRLSADEIEAALRTCPLWSVRGLFLERTFVVASSPPSDKPVSAFSLGASFAVRIAAIADEHDHHPDVDLRYRSVTVRMTTHDADGLTERDFALARALDLVDR
jgi:pterin-4a-carbinolamine dehydratase